MLPRLPTPSEALHQADATVRPLMQSLRAALVASTLDLVAIKTLLIALFDYLSSPAGRTDANCSAVQGFFYLDDDLPLDRLPESFQDVFGYMDALHDTVTSPQIAENFDSTPEHLLRRARSLNI
jgi:hypothetical protein